MKNKLIVLLTTSTLLFSLSAFAKGGQHNDKTCYVTLKDGSSTSSPCSARGTSCMNDYSCTIDGIPGIGTHKKANLKMRAKLKPTLPAKPDKKSSVKKKSATNVETDS